MTATLLTKPKALIVEDDDRIIGSIEDTLYSIGHEHDWVTNQHDAREKLKQGDYNYVLLDLQIPAKPNRGGADKEFGFNLLKDIQRIKGPMRTPVIVMTAYTTDGLELCIDMQDNGASDFIAKPFPNRGRTLATVIRDVLKDAASTNPVWARRAAGTQSPKVPFTGGDLEFYPNHAKLCGVRIITDRGTGQCMAVLNQLRRTDSRGQFVRMSGEDLVTAIDAKGGVGTITGCIQALRSNIINRLGRAGLSVGRDDVIQHDAEGYVLRDWIVVRDGIDGTQRLAIPEVTIDGAVEDANAPKWNRRQLWIREQLEQGIPLERASIEREFGVSEKTAKRDLADLIQLGVVEYYRVGRVGAYRLRER